MGSCTSSAEETKTPVTRVMSRETSPDSEIRTLKAQNSSFKEALGSGLGHPTELDAIHEENSNELREIRSRVSSLKPHLSIDTKKGNTDTNTIQPGITILPSTKTDETGVDTLSSTKALVFALPSETCSAISEETISTVTPGVVAVSMDPQLSSPVQSIVLPMVSKKDSNFLSPSSAASSLSSETPNSTSTSFSTIPITPSPVNNNNNNNDNDSLKMSPPTLHSTRVEFTARSSISNATTVSCEEPPLDQQQQSPEQRSPAKRSVLVRPAREHSPRLVDIGPPTKEYRRSKKFLPFVNSHTGLVDLNGAGSIPPPDTRVQVHTIQCITPNDGHTATVIITSPPAITAGPPNSQQKALIKTLLHHAKPSDVSDGQVYMNVTRPNVHTSSSTAAAALSSKHPIKRFKSLSARNPLGYIRQQQQSPHNQSSRRFSMDAYTHSTSNQEDGTEFFEALTGTAVNHSSTTLKPALCYSPPSPSARRLTPKERFIMTVPVSADAKNMNIAYGDTQMSHPNS